MIYYLLLLLLCKNVQGLKINWKGTKAHPEAQKIPPFIKPGGQNVPLHVMSNANSVFQIFAFVYHSVFQISFKHQKAYNVNRKWRLTRGLKYQVWIS